MNYKIDQALKDRFIKQIEFGGTDKLVNRIDPLVSVSVPTYQHNKYIKECLDSIVNQKTTFLFEIIIGEDGSTDGTREICIEFAEKYPDKIRLFLRDRNFSQYFEDGKFVTRFNGLWNRMSARGKYIAMCEGDDYWIDSLKLQKQINFLETNPDYGLVFHASEYLHMDSGKRTIYKHKSSVIPSTFSINEIMLNDGSFITTNSMVFHSKYVKNLPSWYWHAPAGDYALSLLLASQAKVAYVNEIMSVYRFGVEGSWTKQKRGLKYQLKWFVKMNKLLNSFDNWSNHRYNSIVRKKKIQIKWILTKYLVKKVLIMS